MKYKAFIISAALLAAPVAFAQDNHLGPGPGMPPPPPPQNQSGEGHRPGIGGTIFFQREFNGDGDSSPGATTTPDGRPLAAPVLIRFNGSTTNAIPVRFMASSTGNMFFEARVDGEHGQGIRVRMIGSTTSEMGTSTPPPPHERGGEEGRPAVPGFFIGIFNKLFGGPHDNGNSSTTPPQMRGELNGEGHEGDDLNASTTVDVEASSTPRTPPAAVIEFFQHFFDRFFH